MREKKQYISLSFKGGNSYHQSGTELKLTDYIVNIGESIDCDIRYESNGFTPEYYASIVKNADSNSWCIIKRSQHIDISIQGKGIIGYGHILQDGDIIRFEGQPMALCFHIHNDSHYLKENAKTNRLQLFVACFSALTAIFAIILNIGNKKETISTKDVEPFEESIFFVRGDSVRLMLTTKTEMKPLRPTKALTKDAPTGTAFLTTTGQLITARHCVEYWVGTNLDLTTKVADLAEDDVIRWSIEAESFNQAYHADSTMLLQVFFSIFDFMGNKKYSFVSTDSNVHVNRERDGLFLLADFNNDYYWRTVRPYFNDRQMELGDILWIDGIPDKGKFLLANKEQLEQVKNGTHLMVCGYPVTGMGEKRIVFTEGIIRHNISTDKENLFFESNINHGFSGGPIMMKVGNEVLAVGVVSRVDSISNGLYKLAVPVTEIYN